ncbi:anaphase-promoting complex subunit 11 RING-H2 finger protein [Medicago truncatula]|uniref:Anaphase-promoting complex subunit 11 RING-H2 finger protein n=1 Tax=Medicago truncatula TaxID=3880 RepID=A0A072VRR7_MEDTR|nr:anaphase-promoting complex subunit 11 RING-H2 finger protein [Medicago truncatula]
MSLANIFGLILMFFFSYESKCTAKEMEFPDIPSLPAVRFEDLDGDEDEICSICLVEFEREDGVSKLRRCGHVFHFNCINQWLERSQFSCPLWDQMKYLEQACMGWKIRPLQLASVYLELLEG